METKGISVVVNKLSEKDIQERRINIGVTIPIDLDLSQLSSDQKVVLLQREMSQVRWMLSIIHTGLFPVDIGIIVTSIFMGIYFSIYFWN